MTGNLWLCRFVKVIAGPSLNKRGVVIAIADGVLTIEERLTRTHFTALSSEVKTID